MNDSLDERNFPDTNVLFAFCFSISIFSNFTSESFACGRRKKKCCKEWCLLFASWKLAGSPFSERYSPVARKSESFMGARNALRQVRDRELHGGLQGLPEAPRPPLNAAQRRCAHVQVRRSTLMRGRLVFMYYL